MNNKEILYEEVKSYIESCNCSLRTSFENFKNKSSIIEINCGNCDCRVIKYTFNDFVKRKHKMCRSCISYYNRIENFNKFKRFVEIESNSNCILISSVDDYFNNTSKVIVKCSCGNSFSTNNAMFVHSGKRQCNECGFKRKGQTNKIEYDEAKQILLEYNCELITSRDQYENGTQIVDIRCSCGGGFQNTITQFKYGKTRRCYECYIKEASERKTIPYSEIKYFVEVESDSGCKLITSKENYINTRINIEFECKCGEHFTTSFHEFRSDNKRQCNICGINQMKTTDFIKLFNDSNEVNNCKIIEYEDTNGIILADSIIKLKCACGENFETKRYLFTNYGKNRCEKCSSALTKGEEKIKYFLNNFNIKNKWQYSFGDCRGIRKPLPFDFAVFDNENNLIQLIEYDGKQHFEPVNFGGCSDDMALQEHINLKKNDEIKNTYCNENNIPLLRIPYWDFDDIEEILENELIKYEYKYSPYQRLL